MKKLTIMLGVALCAVFVMSSCRSSRESAYRKAYEKAKQQELAQPATTQAEQQTQEAPVADVPVVVKPKSDDASAAREERATVQGDGILKEFSVVCGSFQTKANADALTGDVKSFGYPAALEVQNPDTKMYRVIFATFDDKASAASARDAFKAKFPDRKDFQGAWILKRVY